MTIEKYKELAETYNIIPVYKIITGDLLTPVLAFARISVSGKHHILLESVEGIGRLSRYSFISKNPSKIIYNYGKELIIESSSGSKTINEDIFNHLKNLISHYRKAPVEDLPDFTGGIIGYIGYENIALIESSINFKYEENYENPDSILGLYDSIIAFDHYKHRLILIKNVFIEDPQNAESLYYAALDELSQLEKELNSPGEELEKFRLASKPDNEIDADFGSIIAKCKKDIYNGEIFQIVFSKRFNAEFKGDLFNVYRALRMINPSPYMYFLNFNGYVKIAGTSPEDLLSVINRKATILPIAGTRKRGITEAEDSELERDLLSDPKELAEHTMLVDLARNDLGRVCKFNTIRVTEDKKVNRFSHVMHIVSRVEGKLRDDKDCIDALKASFPAGTVTGAPKIRAIQLLSDYENTKRNVYAGAVGYVDFSGNLDMCIAIRTLFSIKNKIYWQAGAGIVADSNAKNEAKEILNKSAVLFTALKYAENL